MRPCLTSTYAPSSSTATRGMRFVQTPISAGPSRPARFVLVSIGAPQVCTRSFKRERDGFQAAGSLAADDRRKTPKQGQQLAHRGRVAEDRG